MARYLRIYENVFFLIIWLNQSCKEYFHDCGLHKLCLVRSPNRPTCPSLYFLSHPRGVQSGCSALGESPGAGESVPVLQRRQLHLWAAAVVSPQPPGPAGRAGQTPGAGLQERAPLRRHPWWPAVLPGALQQLDPGLHRLHHTAAGRGSLCVWGSEQAERGEAVPVQIHLCQRWERKKKEKKRTLPTVTHKHCPPYKALTVTTANYREQLNPWQRKRTQSHLGWWWDGGLKINTLTKKGPRSLIPTSTHPLMFERAPSVCTALENRAGSLQGWKAQTNSCFIHVLRCNLASVPWG